MRKLCAILAVIAFLAFSCGVIYAAVCNLEGFLVCMMYGWALAGVICVVVYAIDIYLFIAERK